MKAILIMLVSFIISCTSRNNYDSVHKNEFTQTLNDKSFPKRSDCRKPIFITSKDCYNLDFIGDSLIITENEHWGNRYIYKLNCVNKYEKKKYYMETKDEKQELRFSLADSILFFYELKYGKSDIYTLSIGDNINTIIDTSLTKNKKISYINIGMPHMTSTGFEFYFKEKKLKHFKVTNCSDISNPLGIDY